MELWELSSEFSYIDVEHDTMAICNPQVREAAGAYNDALDKVRFGRTAEARADLRRATQLYPGFDDAYILLGLCVFASGNRIDAMRTFNQIADPEKHSLAMRYFDMLSLSSKDMVSDYKKKQGYREPVRTQSGTPEPPRRSPAREDGRNAGRTAGGAGAGATGAGAGAVADSGSFGSGRMQEGRVRRETVPEGEGAGRRKTPGEAGNAARERELSRSRQRGPSQTETDSGRGAAESRKTGMSAREPEEGFFDFGETGTSEKPPVFFRQETEEERENLFYEIEKIQRSSAGNAASSREKVSRSGRTAGESAPAGGRKEAAPVRKPGPAESAAGRSGRTAAPRTGERAGEPSARRNRVMAFIVVSCFAILAAAAVVVAGMNRESLFGTGSFVHGPDTVKTSPAPSTPARQPARETEPPASETGTPPAVSTPEQTATPDPETRKTEASDRLAKAVQLLKDRAYHECYVSLAEYDWTYLPVEQNALLTETKDKAFTAFCNDYYNRMYASVSPENWDDVLLYGLELLKYCPDYERGAPVYFNVGKAYEEKGDKASAEKYYRLTMEKYPDSNDASYAQYKLSHLYD